MKRILCLVLSILSLASPVWAAITFDTATTQTGTSSTTGSHTIAADANIVIVCLSIRDVGGAVQAATGVTVGGAAATFLDGQTNAGNVMRSELWYKLAPATGAQTVAATGHASTDVMLSGIMSFKGVAQTSTFNTVGKNQVNSDANMDVNTLASAVGEMGVLCGSARSVTTFSPDATSPASTERLDANHTVGSDPASICGYTEDGAASSIDMRVDLSASVQWAAVAVSMRPLTERAGRGSVPIIY